MKRNLFFLLVLSCFFSVHAQDTWYVAPSNGATGDGSEMNPWDLQSALTSGNGVAAGDTILLAGGYYNGRYVSTISGTAANPITVRSKDGEWAVLNGNVPLPPYPTSYTTQGALYLPPITGSSYVHFMDFEITSLETVQPLTRDGEDPNYIGITGVNHVGGVDCKFINLVIHNMPGQGVGSWKPTRGTEFYGCIVYNNGVVRLNPDTENYEQYEHGFYIQNNGPASNPRIFSNNIVFNNFGKGMLLWSSTQCGSVDPDSPDGGTNVNACDFLKNVNFINNVNFNSGNVSYPGQGGGRDNIDISTYDMSMGKIPKNIIVDNNILYHNVNFQVYNSGSGPSLSFGKNGANRVQDITVTNNMIIGRNYAVRLFSIGPGFLFQNNTVYNRFALSTQTNMNDNTGWNFDLNKYFIRDAFGGYKLDPPNTNYNFEGWKTLTGGDSNSISNRGTKFQDVVDFPENFVKKITQNEYNSNKYTVVIVNPNNLNNVTLDFSDYGLGGTGDIDFAAPYTLKDVENYTEGIPIEGTISSNYTVNIPIGSLTAFESPLKPINTVGVPEIADSTQKTPTNFGVFIIEFENICPTETTWTASGWDNGIPDANLKAIIDAPYSALANGDFTACSLEITNNGSMTIEANRTITVINNVANNATKTDFVIKDDASLVMVANTGTVTGRYTVEKKWAEHLFTGNPGEDSDKFSIWSTPVEEVGSLPKEDIFSFQSLVYYFDGGTGVFDGISNGERLKPSLGYYVRQNDGSDFDINVPRQFEGTINNGIHSNPVTASATDPKFYFFGNPYPSAIDWFKFWDDNQTVLSTDKAVYFWKQVNPSIAYEQQPPQWVVLNDTGSVPIGENVTGTANEFISTAQGFTTEVVAAGDVVFKNSQRVAGNNDQFFNPTNNDGKLWLNLKTSSTGFDQILIAFVDPITSDAKYNSDGAGVELYSLDGDKKLSIQAVKSLNTENVSMPLGFNASEPGDYSFNIEQEYIDSNFNIILEDTELNTFTDLRLGDYNFTTTQAATSDTRFVLNFNYVEPIDVSFTHEKPCDSYGTTLDFFYTGGTEDVSFLWDFGPNATPQTSTETNPVGIVFPEGDQSVTLTVFKNGQSQSLTETISVVDVGSSGNRKVVVCHNGENIITISENALQTHLSHGDCVGPCDDTGFAPLVETRVGDILLYPNPVSNELNIELHFEEDYSEIKIIDISGRVVLQEDIEQNIMTLNVSSLSKGLYFLSVDLEDQIIGIKKFIKN